MTQARSRFQTKLAVHPKLAKRTIFAESEESYRVEQLRDPATGMVHADGCNVTRITTDYYTSLMRPHHDRPKTGKYLPRAVPRNYPWTNGVDPFDLRSLANTPSPTPGEATPQDSCTLFDTTCDKAVFLVPPRQRQGPRARQHPQ
jgi:hypothetical protein